MNRLRFVPIATPTDRPPEGTVWLYVDSTSGVLNAIDSQGTVTPAGTAGTDGQSAYELAVELGYEGTEEEWIESLQGAEGAPADPAEIEALQNRATVLEAYVSTTLPSLLTEKAPLTSPALTGNPTAPTQALGNNSTRIATTAFVVAQLAAEIQAIVGLAPSTLDTLQEIAARIVSGESDLASLSAAIAGKVATTRTVNGHALTADVTVTKGDVGLGNVDNTSDVNKPVSSAQLTALNAKAPLASPAFTGNPTCPLQAPGANNNRLASTQYVSAEIGIWLPNSGVAMGYTAWVSLSGNDGTGVVGNPNKPYSTGTAAWAAVMAMGLGGGSIIFGCGTFSIDTGNQPISKFTIIGQGGRAYDHDELTVVTVYTDIGSNAINGNGSNGADCKLHVVDCHVTISAQGQGVYVDDGNVYLPGSGGLVSLTGRGSIGQILTNAGGGSSSSGGTLGNSGTSIRVFGQFCFNGATINCSQGEASGSGYNFGVPGHVYLDGCDLRNVSSWGAVSGVHCGRCFGNTPGPGLTTDFGGNAFSWSSPF